jgi:hypothetical protein
MGDLQNTRSIINARVIPVAKKAPFQSGKHLTPARVENQRPASRKGVPAILRPKLDRKGHICGVGFKSLVITTHQPCHNPGNDGLILFAKASLSRGQWHNV